jgi:hypothetical protein
MSGAEFIVKRKDLQKEEIINVENGVDYEKEAPNSRFEISCKGIGLKR